jgi:ElaB/YqjD/DUF883 family membrane-anchored ribosome-binding protein
MLPEKMSTEFREAVDQQSSVGAYQAIEVAVDEKLKDFSEKLEREYEKVMQASGEAAYQELNEQLKTNLKFKIEKAAKRRKPMSPAVRAAAREMIVPINPYSIKWMRERSTKLIQYVREQQAQTIQDVLSNTFSRGLRPELVYDEIKQNIGLTPRDAVAVENRMELLRAQGYLEAEIASRAAQYRERLLDLRAEKIGRTETISAQAQGRLDSWRGAQEAGILPGVVREWVSAPPGPPGRPCNSCLGMNRLHAEVGGAYESPEYGSVECPPLHPQCRCSEILVKE